MMLLGLCLVSLWASARAGEAYLEDLNEDHARRNFGLPEELRFRLRHAGGLLDLHLQENKRLNSHAPMFVADGNGFKRVATPVSTVKHYQDKRNGAFMTVDCVLGQDGPCVRSLKGNLVVNSQEYSLEPVHNAPTYVHPKGVTGMLHTMEEIETHHKTDVVNGKKRILNNDVVVISDDEKKAIYERRNHVNAAKRKQLLATLLERLGKVKSIRKRQTQSPVAHGVEVFLAIDHLIYQKFGKLHSGHEEILLRIREYFSHIINGVDLRYANIQEDDISFYVTVAGFYVSTNAAESPWMNYNVAFPDGNVGIQNMINWHLNSSFPEHDHAALMVGTDFAVGGSSDTVGYAYLEAVCKDWGVSLNEDLSFFKTSGILAHELGHSLGAPHDSGEAGTDCSMYNMYIMQPFIPNLSSTSTTINPWRWSSCSVNSMRTYVNSMGSSSCTLDRANIYDPDEFAKHTEGLAGQIYSEDEQCELLNGDNSRACKGTTNIDAVCRSLKCTYPGTDTCDDDATFVAAHGTPCGTKKMCFEGLCVDAAGTPAPTTQSPTTQAPTTQAPTTQAPTTQAPTTQAPTTQAPTTPPPSTPAPTSGTTTPDYYGGFVCKDHIDGCQLLLDWLGRFKTCRFRTLECCETCTEKACSGERLLDDGEFKYDCDELEDYFGYDTTCELFTWECCKRCGDPTRRNIGT